MSQEPEKKFGRFYELTKHPLIYIILGALLGGHIVITGFQLNIGLTILNILLLLAAIIISFILGMGFLPIAILSLITKTNLPWYYRVIVKIVSIIMAPFTWFSARGRRQQSQSETDKNVQAILDQIRTSKEQRENEPPTQSTH